MDCCYLSNYFNFSGLKKTVYNLANVLWIHDVFKDLCSFVTFSGFIKI